MSYAKALAVGLLGLHGQVVEVEADLAVGLPGLSLVGLPDTALYEARDRIRAAIVNSGQVWPTRRITVNLLPAALPKQGSSFDLAMAIVILASAGALPQQSLHDTVLLGELGLDGMVRPVRGVLPAVRAAAQAGIGRAVVPAANAREAALVPGITVRAIDSLRRMIDFCCGSGELLAAPATCLSDPLPGPDLAEVVGQATGRRGGISRCWRSSPFAGWTAWSWQNHAGPATAIDFAEPVRRRCAGG
jgi:magnesium chelatase family protein